MRQNRILAIGIIFLLTGMAIVAQVRPEYRIEIQLKNGYANETIFKSQTGFFVIQAEAEKATTRGKEIRYDLYDKTLTAIKTVSVYVPVSRKTSMVYNDDTMIYKLFVDKNGEYVLYSIHIEDLKTDSVKGKFPKSVILQDMKIVNSKAWFQASQKKKTCIIQLDMQTGQTLISEYIEKTEGKKTSIVNYQFSPVLGELLVFLNKYIKKGVCELSQMSVNGNCELCKHVQLTGTGDRVISSVSGCRVSDNKMVYTGTYSRSYTQVSEGMFFAKAVNDSLSYIHYINFLDMKNFLANTSKLNQKITGTVKNIYKKMGKEYSKKFLIITHDVVLTPDGYLLIGEVYHPTYHTNTYTTTSFVNGMAMTQVHSYTVFDGYQYTNAFVAGFSADGNFLWDQSFDMNSVERPYYPKKFVRISEKTDNHIVLVYASGSIIGSKIIGFDGTVEKETDLDFINTGNDNEKTIYTTSGAEYWYDNYFLIYGTQSLKNLEDKSRRKVFYVNKIEF